MRSRHRIQEGLTRREHPASGISVQPTGQRTLVGRLAILAVHVDDAAQIVGVRVLQQGVEGGVVHPRRQRRPGQRRIPNAERRHIAVVIHVAVGGPAKVHAHNFSNEVVFARAGQPKLPVDEHLHDARFRILGEGPVDPLPFQNAFARALLDAVVSAIESTVPVYSAVAPWDVHVHFALVERIDALEKRGVGGQHRGISTQPTLQRDGRVHPQQRDRIDLHAVVSIHAHKLRCTGGRGVAGLGQGVGDNEGLDVQTAALRHIHSVQGQIHQEVHVRFARQRLAKVHVP